MSLEKSKTPLLNQVKFPADLKKFSLPEIKQISDELRLATISAVSQTGGHLGAGLGVVEITTASHLHRGKTIPQRLQISVIKCH